MEIDWKLCSTYEEARDFSRIIYLHVWNDLPFYWGKAHNSFFGGHLRAKDGLKASGRYNSGYRHWIEGCLRHGAQLYIGKLDKEALKNINEIENYLIYTYGHVMNTRIKNPGRDLKIDHIGAKPKLCNWVNGTVSTDNFSWSKNVNTRQWTTAA